ncbi:hypothetical protein [Sphaerisporangium dianthi]|uniref:Uncharacterized protein n=1 Tax=Sphaerisporangium dianthi TaxID=1436120 RepID=A0ABV9CA97_9ACTN
MDMSWQTTFVLACAALCAAVVPGTLGYATARNETADQQRQELVRLRAEVQTARKLVRGVSSFCEAETGDAGASSSRSSGSPAPLGSSRSSGSPAPLGSSRSSGSPAPLGSSGRPGSPRT